MRVNWGKKNTRRVKYLSPPDPIDGIPPVSYEIKALCRCESTISNYSRIIFIEGAHGVEHFSLPPSHYLDASHHDVYDSAEGNACSK